MAGGNFGGGNGGLDKPYLVEDAADLNAVRNQPSACYLQTKDITLSGEWTPLPPFSGIYDGGGKEIRNLVMNLTTSGHVGTNYHAGLFSSSTGRIVRTTIGSGMINFVKEGGFSVNLGAVCGASISSSSVFDDNHNKGCTISVDISSNSRDLYVGGVVGSCHNINGSSNSAKINTILSISYSSGSFGGVIGGLSSGTANDCFNTGNISANSQRVSGVIGSSAGGYPTAHRCYNSGDILNESNYAFGISSGSVVVNDSYNTGNITSKGGFAAGISEGSAVDSYNSGNIYAHSGAFGIGAGRATRCYSLGAKITRLPNGINDTNWHRVSPNPNSCYSIDTLTLVFE